MFTMVYFTTITSMEVQALRPNGVQDEKMSVRLTYLLTALTIHWNRSTDQTHDMVVSMETIKRIS